MRRVTVASFSLLISGGILVLVASSTLNSKDLVLYAAFTSFNGIFAMVPSSAIEQHFSKVGTLNFGQNRFNKNNLTTFSQPLITFFGFLLSLIIIWNLSNFHVDSLLLPAFVVGVTLSLLSSFFRGHLIYNSDFRTYSMAHFTQAVSLLLVPYLLFSSGLMSLFDSLIFGQAIALGSPLVFSFKRLKKIFHTDSLGEKIPNKDFVKLAYLNAAIFINLLSAQIAVRSNVNLTSSQLGSQFQIYLTYSRLITLISLGMFPILIWHYRQKLLMNSKSSVYLRNLIASSFPATLIGVLVSAFLIIEIRNESNLVSLFEISLIGISAISFSLGIIFTTKAIALNQITSAIKFWALGFLPMAFLLLNQNLSTTNFSLILLVQSTVIIFGIRKIAL